MSRALLGRVGKDGSDTVNVADDVQTLNGSNVGLRIAAVFIILSAGLLGGVPPLFIKALRNQNSLPTFLIRAFSAGIILALALVHILPEAVEELVDLGGVDYPLGGTSILVGLFVMVFIEHAAHLAYDMPHAHAHAPSSDGASGDTHSHSHGQGHIHSHGALNGSGFGALTGEPSPASSAAETAEWGSDKEGRRKLPTAATTTVAAGQPPSPEGGRHPPHSGWLLGHLHTYCTRLHYLCPSVGCWFRSRLGCIFHSFIIGLSLGVNRTSKSQVRALLIALTFHQALEGLSLASVINGGDFSRTRAAVMVATYSVTCPLGVAIGIAIAASYDPSSIHARAAQGCLNGVSGGMLLYISLVQLVAEDMGKYLLGPPPAAATDADGGGEAASPVSAAITAAAPPDLGTGEPRGSALPCSHGGKGHHFHGGGHLAVDGGGRVGGHIRGPSFLAFCLGAASMCLLARSFVTGHFGRMSYKFFKFIH
ncbi:hypothetical protein VOLCADRAFT_91723 [Volvox carteri f. nagariensis]|uniref:Uncharacterized protein n=1 Tax=Volvox carteri f. nagariensis TaxID=3068 RepID=D8TXU0_VOLCA|nr:uncharacterized protein VOLCADRAFT_91723 [Volvox carteri f. nagariensis]EFJ47700.1 hypothetical protein VOLCADRAFT_91723 [Volvox carteri f. nagariensis]|eukprot:XP_002951171.1 hypothetical protein VOLCADRAFT_91723 [Volvox carteri f. nagariensis]